MTPRESAELEAERTFESFMLWTKRVIGKSKSGSQYNGEQYDPMNLNVKD